MYLSPERSTRSLFIVEPLPTRSCQPAMDWFRSVVSSKTSTDSLTIWYGTEKFPVTFEKNAISAKRATLEELKSHCSRRIGTPKLRYYFAGVELANDDKPLAEYGIRSGAQVLVMEDFRDNARTHPQTFIADNTRLSLLNRTNIELCPQVDGYLKSTPTDPVKNKEIHARLGELLLQRLLDLDAIDIPQDLEDASEARQKRRNAVKWTQSLLDKVDEQFRTTCSAEE
ncbi:BAG family molecular chaperone regulator 1B [Neolecta irregularis DAH-3]|uniref:BAG family molecular chaperone regulator 1B n=1 Tax=Neolecta irregularis (strain DAH-3) TaxID=1198029 RepID=A0A1U7LR01_NEOID|nr:BAG family molecular chaperone regulator 1B [Neolecta irregularis DAH-3]|eukprot:OLL25059.1 BAG family molecular chaperone regulator 1B [Neolecta irregularis DAH-3]